MVQVQVSEWFNTKILKTYYFSCYSKYKTKLIGPIYNFICNIYNWNNFKRVFVVFNVTIVHLNDLKYWSKRYSAELFLF